VSVPLFFDLIESDQLENTLRQFASANMSTDWGVRGVSRQSKYYDPISYNNGSVWPFTTGYVATAQHKHHRAINGWHNLLANVSLTWLDALGWQTELLSGEYCRPVSTSVPHQLFSASAIINPLVMGLLGLEGDTVSRKITFAPHLPMDWNELVIKNYQCGKDSFDILFHKSIDKLKLEIINRAERSYQFFFSPAFGLETKIESVSVNGKAVPSQLKTTPYDVHCEIKCDLRENLSVEIQYQQGIEFNIPSPEIQIGSPSQGLKLIDYNLLNNVFTITVQGFSEKEYVIPVKTDFKIENVEGGRIKKINDHLWELVTRFNNTSKDFVTKKIQLYLNKSDRPEN